LVSNAPGLAKNLSVQGLHQRLREFQE